MAIKTPAERRRHPRHPLGAVRRPAPGRRAGWAGRRRRGGAGTIKPHVGSASCTYFQDLDRALADSRADAALIVSPSVLHAEQAIRCLDAGLDGHGREAARHHVAEARRVLERARAVGKQVIVAENYRFLPAERTIRRLIGEGFLGAIDHAMLIDRRKKPSRTEGPWLGKIEYPQLQEIAIAPLRQPARLLRPAPGRASPRGSGTRPGPTTSTAPTPRP